MTTLHRIEHRTSGLGYYAEGLDLGEHTDYRVRDDYDWLDYRTPARRWTGNQAYNVHNHPDYLALVPRRIHNSRWYTRQVDFDGNVLPEWEGGTTARPPDGKDNPFFYACSNVHSLCSWFGVPFRNHTYAVYAVITVPKGVPIYRAKGEQVCYRIDLPHTKRTYELKELGQRYQRWVEATAKRKGIPTP